MKFSIVTHWCRLLPNLVIVSVFCIFLFWIIFFIPIVCLEIFLRSKIFSQSILIIFELSLFYNWTHVSWLVRKFQEKKGVWSLIPFCFIWFLLSNRHTCSFEMIKTLYNWFQKEAFNECSFLPALIFNGFFLEDAWNREMTTCIPILLKNKNFLGSLFFPFFFK